MFSMINDNYNLSSYFSEGVDCLSEGVYSCVHKLSAFNVLHVVYTEGFTCKLVERAGI